MKNLDLRSSPHGIEPTISKNRRGQTLRRAPRLYFNSMEMDSKVSSPILEKKWVRPVPGM